MPALLNQPRDLLELRKIALLLRGQKAESIKKRDYVLDDRGEVIDFVVPDAVCPGAHRSAFQPLLKHAQDDLIALGDVEAQGSVPCHRLTAAPAKGHVEAAFTIGESS